jgi:hypothetical protein
MFGDRMGLGDPFDPAVNLTLAFNKMPSKVPALA